MSLLIIPFLYFHNTAYAVLQRTYLVCVMYVHFKISDHYCNCVTFNFWGGNLIKKIPIDGYGIVITFCCLHYNSVKFENSSQDFGSTWAC